MNLPEDGVDPRDYRNTVGLFATGVTVVATETEGEVHAMTANAVTSLSLDPTLIIVCVDKRANMAKSLQGNQPFCFSILSAEQEDLSSYFARMWKEGEPPPPFSWVTTPGGPRLEGCLAAIGCVPHETLEGGDHWIVIGRVIDLYRPDSPGAPLLYHQGRYARLA